MSRIRFEWEVEADIIDQPDGEDPQLKRTRHRKLLHLLLLMALLAVACLLGGLALYLRLVQAQNEIAQQLSDTIKVEVAALRIGDRNAFLRIQSDDAGWQAAQSALFEQVQALKTADAITLPGDILSLAIEDERARALVREDVHGLPYARLAFYRRADGIWRHTAPDFTFWGKQLQSESSRVVVQYREADAVFAEQLGADVGEWIEAQCAEAACEKDGALHIDILPEMAETVTWLAAGGGRLLVRSPYLHRVRADTPLDSELFALLQQHIRANWAAFQVAK